MVVTLGQRYDVGEKPNVVWYTCINRHAGTPNKTKTKDSISLDYSSICYIGPKIGWVSMKEIFKSWIDVFKEKIRTRLDLLSTPQSGGGNVKTFKDQRLQIQNHFFVVVEMILLFIKDRLAIAIRSLKDRCVTIVSLTQVLV